eukprot:scaffold44985_cov68-Phaeocystis_antarctica.AAC.6
MGLCWADSAGSGAHCVRPGPSPHSRPSWLRRPSLMPVTETKVAQASASWLSGGGFQRQSMPQAAPSFGQPRPISRSRCAGQPYRACLDIE